MPRVYEKAITLFEALHDATDDLFLVIDNYEEKKTSVFLNFSMEVSVCIAIKI